MAISMKNVDAAFHNAGQKVGMEIWRIESFQPVPVPKSNYGKFYSGDSYIILFTTALKSGALHHDIHFWLGKNTSQDEAGTAAIKAVELDAALGGRAVQYREVQGYETDKFLTYFRPCIIPLEGGVASGFKKVEQEIYEPRLFLCKGRRVVRVKEVPYSRTSLNHDDVFILDTKTKIFQFNGANASIQEKAKSLEAVQYIKDTYHEGKCEVAIIEDGKLVAEADTGEFWSLFGGFAPIGKKGTSDDDFQLEGGASKLFCVLEGQLKEVEASSLHRGLLKTDKCYLLDCGAELYVWTGRNTSLDQRKTATKAAEEFIISNKKPYHTHITRVIEGFETLMFRSNFNVWPQGSGNAVSEEGRGKVAALLKQQGINVKGLLKAAPPVKEDIPPLLDGSGKLQVWRVNGKSKSSLPAEEIGKFYSGDCYLVLYTYPGDRKEEYLLCSWLGKHSSEAAAARLANDLADSKRGRPVQARYVEGKEPPQFIALFQGIIVFQGGQSSGYKQLISSKDLIDETYSEESVALFRVRGTGPHNTRAVQVKAAATSLNSSDCFILQTERTLFLWYGSFSGLEEQQVANQLVEVLKPGVTAKSIKEGTEPAPFWNAIGDKKAYPSQRDAKETEKDSRLFAWNSSKGSFEVTEIFNYTQEDLLSDDVMILDAYNEIFIWFGQLTSKQEKQEAFNIAQKYLERGSLLEGLSVDTPVYKIVEGSEPAFFMRYFSWDPAKSSAYADPFDRKLASLQGRPIQTVENPPKKRTPVVDAGEAGSIEKGTGPSPNGSGASSATQRKAALAALSSVFNASTTSEALKPPSFRKSPSIKSPSAEETGPESPPQPPVTDLSPQAKVESLVTSLPELNLATEEVENDTKALTYGYEQLKVKSADPVDGIDVTKRESYLSSAEFERVFGIAQTHFYKLPKWKQDQLKRGVDLF
ncbi:hypothetical protein O6H91_05G094900 [Diphasiastrum complanatum]|uniref:Uncharacterized protein n=3 Tax=Diphasiastrum complanatum TaxID=34168 RepID=A0ACC2DQY3_DIPCM|nr:hypothetical protein O6H91_05G094900 [Diphasiastrum complanatum]KAJ7556703.1 hypothetical protein O6H91_05G094900 [Diphasiastrum complanatum]KAJ7556706.1 hypothetical protein O6H91_05G094900 [Diphasiastrum complanatum]